MKRMRERIINESKNIFIISYRKDQIQQQLSKSNKDRGNETRTREPTRSAQRTRLKAEFTVLSVGVAVAIATLRHSVGLSHPPLLHE